MDITASELMTKEVVALRPDMTLVEMDEILRERGVSGAPVVVGRRLVGVASQADIIRALWEEHHEAYRHGTYYSSPFLIPISALEYISRDAPQIGNRLVELRVSDIMTSEPLVAHPDDPIEEISKQLVREEIHRLPIVDPESGDLVGILSTLDLVRAISVQGLGAIF